jgi:hypothetical protein
MRDEVTRAAARRATLVAVPAALLVGALAFWLLGGFGRGTAPPRPMATGPVEMAAPALDERAAAVCRALLSRLPDALDGLPRRPVTAGSAQNVAYGDPPITLACGAVPPPSLPPDVFGLSGVCWYADETRPGVTVWTTADREVPLTVTVPRSYDPPGQRVIALTDPIIAAVPVAGQVPTGCR